MKTFTLLIVSILVSASAFSQITINSGDFPSVGDHYVWASDDMPAGVSPGSSGANQTWNFTGMMEDYISDAIFVTPASTPYASNYPGANIATNTDDTVYSYMIKNSSKASVLGTVVVPSSGDPLIFNTYPEELLAQYPVNYLDEWEEDFYSEYFISTGQPGVDSMRFKSDKEKDVIVDAWGTVTIPLGTYNALRVKETEVSYDSTWFKIAGVWMLQFTSTDTYYSYEWWTNQGPIAPFVVNMSSSDDFATIDDITWVKDFQVGVDELSAQNSLSVYPNPASDHVIIQTEEKDGYNVRIINSAGQVVQHNEIQGKDIFRLDISGLASGLYHCVITNKTDGTMNSGLFSVKR